MNKKFSDQLELWWKYIDLIILKILRSPLPTDPFPVFDMVKEEDGKKIMKTYHTICLFIPDWYQDEYYRNRFELFLIPESAIMYVDDIMGFDTESDEYTGLRTAIGHEEDIVEAKEQLKYADQLAEEYLEDIKSSYPELSSFSLYSTDVKSVEEMQMYTSVLESLEKSEACKMFADMLGNGIIKDIRAGLIADTYVKLYEVLGLSSASVRADVYFKGAESVYNHQLLICRSKNSEKIIEKYKDIYFIYEKFIRAYVTHVRSFMHTRLQKSMMIETLSRPSSTDIFKIFEPDNGSRITGFVNGPEVYKDSNSVEERLTTLIERMEGITDDESDRVFTVYYPWANLLVRNSTKGGNGGDECYNR